MRPAPLWSTDAQIAVETENAGNASEQARTRTLMKVNRNAAIAPEQVCVPPVTATDRH